MVRGKRGERVGRERGGIDRGTGVRGGRSGEGRSAGVAGAEYDRKGGEVGEGEAGD